jgi:hypothetical protein
MLLLRLEKDICKELENKSQINNSPRLLNKLGRLILLLLIKRLLIKLERSPKSDFLANI